jgi:hypothetical protein
MIRLFAAALLLAAAAVPALACDYHKSVSTDNGPSTVASQPATDHAAPASGKAAADQSPS